MYHPEDKDKISPQEPSEDNALDLLRDLYDQIDEGSENDLETEDIDASEVEHLWETLISEDKEPIAASEVETSDDTLLVPKPTPLSSTTTATYDDTSSRSTPTEVSPTKIEEVIETSAAEAQTTEQREEEEEEEEEDVQQVDDDSSWRPVPIDDLPEKKVVEIDPADNENELIDEGEDEEPVSEPDQEADSAETGTKTTADTPSHRRKKRFNIWSFFGEGPAQIPWLRNNVPLLLLFVALSVLSVYNEYRMQEKIRRIATLEQEVHDYQNRELLKRAALTNMGRKQSIEKAVESEDLNLVPSSEPPYILYTDLQKEEKKNKKR